MICEYIMSVTVPYAENSIIVTYDSSNELAEADKENLKETTMNIFMDTIRKNQSPWLIFY